MPEPPGRRPRPLLVLLSLLVFCGAPSGFATGAPAAESTRIPFTQRYHAVQSGGVVRAGNASISCRTTQSPRVSPCATVRAGADGVNGDFDMFYTDEDDDPNTYNSSRAALVLPRNAQVTYARLYWGGNLRVGEQKPAKDNGRVLIAEEGGQYKEVLADTEIGHNDADTFDSFQASADITPLVRGTGSGLYTVAQINVAMGQSDIGAWGGWTMVVAYENSTEPVRHISIWDGFETVDGQRKSLEVSLSGLRIPAGASGRAGFVAYDGDRGSTGDTVNVRTGDGKSFGLSGDMNPADDLMNSSIVGPDGVMNRKPAHLNTLGYDSDVFDIASVFAPDAASEPSSEASELTFRFTAEDLGYTLGVLFVQADTRR
ncbi:DUF3344 domain-containing protein [Streptomyces sp. NPDC057638]|uniref:DUF3344 domain-containing protein n=1 Tax=Streptomyces sp. NPDC057638 TaxID=3346190 RepID=UPI0036928EF5